MAVRQVTYSTTPGINYLQSVDFVLSEVAFVARTGMVYSIVTGTPGNLEVQHDSANGKLIFLNNFEGGGPTATDLETGQSEKVFVISKY